MLGIYRVGQINWDNFFPRASGKDISRERKGNDLRVSGYMYGTQNNMLLPKGKDQSFTLLMNVFGVLIEVFAD